MVSKTTPNSSARRGSEKRRRSGNEMGLRAWRELEQKLDESVELSLLPFGLHWRDGLWGAGRHGDRGYCRARQHQKGNS